MNKGFIQAGNLIFIVLLLVMLLSAGYLYFFSDQQEILVVADGVKADLGAGLKFVHPVYQYSLNFPYSWKDKYQVSEDGGQTKFWYVAESGKRDLLFSVARQSTGESVQLLGSSKSLGERAGSLYRLITPQRVSGTLSPVDNQMRQEVIAAGETFSFLDKNQSDIDISKGLENNSLASSSPQINFSVFEIMATSETASSTEYYIWFSRQQFVWNGFRLSDGPRESKPAAVMVTKDNNSVSVRIPREGVNFNLDVKKIFPASVYRSTLFVATTTDHLALLDKLANELSDQQLVYFGALPVITRAGLIREISADQNGIVLHAQLADRVIQASNSAYSLIGVSKVSSQFFVSSSTAPLLLPAVMSKDKAGATTTVSVAQEISLEQLPSFFSRTSTSTWRQKPFWFEIRDGEVLKIYPL